jgi:hypothetical protein
MKTLRLDVLRVDSFATTAGAVPARTTGSPACPISYGGTCWITCTTCLTEPDVC